MGVGVFLHKVIHNFCESAPTRRRFFLQALRCTIIGRTSALHLRGDLPLLSIIQAAGWPIWPLVVCSILAMALVIERFLSLKTAKVLPPRLLDEALAVSRSSVPAPDVVAQLAQNSALGEVLASGFRALNSDPRCTELDLHASMEQTGRAVAHRLERETVRFRVVRKSLRRARNPRARGSA